MINDRHAPWTCVCQELGIYVCDGAIKHKCVKATLCIQLLLGFCLMRVGVYNLIIS